MAKSNTAPDFLPNHPLWEYSIDLYGHQPVALACLQLQDKHRMNVNVMLLICWLAKTGRGRLQVDDIQKLLHSIESWNRNITKKLRNLRRFIKRNQRSAEYEAIKKDVQRHELAVEKMEQLFLLDGVYRHEAVERANLQKANDAISSFIAYSKLKALQLEQRDKQAIQDILFHVFPMVSQADMSELFEQALQPVMVLT